MKAKGNFRCEEKVTPVIQSTTELSVNKVKEKVWQKKKEKKKIIPDFLLWATCFSLTCILIIHTDTLNLVSFNVNYAALNHYLTLKIRSTF